VIVDGKRVEVAYADVAEANLVFELAPQPKPGQPKPGQPKPGRAASGHVSGKKSTRAARSS
jgi:hypothetical protein